MHLFMVLFHYGAENVGIFPAHYITQIYSTTLKVSFNVC